VDETPSAEEAAEIAATTVFEPDVPDAEIVAEIDDDAPPGEQPSTPDGELPEEGS
jgi:hypothetical protein